jgi:hypothetical protein
MRLIKVLVVVVAVVSLFGNFVMIMKYSGRRPIMSVNGEPVSKRDLDNYLEQRVGPQVKAELVQQMLIDQEAKRLNVVPTDKEIEDAFVDMREVNWQMAREVAVKPWLADDYKKNIRLGLERSRILAHDVQVTDDMRRDEYDRSPMRYDTPNKAHTQFALVMNEQHLQDIKQLMEKGINPQVIMSDLKGSVVFIGYDNKVTLSQVLGDPNQNKDVFNMKPGDVRDFMPGEFARLGAKRLVVRLIDKVPGKKADLSDPKTKETLTLAVALQRSKPWQEYLASLWANTKFDCEDANDKRYVELNLFPERARASASESK